MQRYLVNTKYCSIHTNFYANLYSYFAKQFKIENAILKTKIPLLANLKLIYFKIDQSQIRIFLISQSELTEAKKESIHAHAVDIEKARRDHKRAHGNNLLTHGCYRDNCYHDKPIIQKTINKSITY